MFLSPVPTPLGLRRQAAQIVGVTRVVHADGPHLAHGLAEQHERAGACPGRWLQPHLVPRHGVGQETLRRAWRPGSTWGRSPTSPRWLRPIPSSGPSTRATPSRWCRAWTATKVITVRTTGFDPAAATGGAATVDVVAAVADAGKSVFLGSEIAKNDRPELTAAKIIVSGGRALGSSEKFNEVLTTAGRQARCGAGCVACGGGRRLCAQRLAGGADPARSWRLSCMWPAASAARYSIWQA